MDLFFEAAKGKYLFPTKVGLITTSDLFDLPLEGKSASLNSTAITINKELKESEEESFVTNNNSTENKLLRNKLEIVKAVIQHKLELKEAEVKRKEKAETKRKLLAALENKKEEKLSSSSEKELLKQLKQLEDES